MRFDCPMQGGGGNAERDKPLYLIAHERDERGHDERERWQKQRRQLIEQRFTGTGGKDRENVVAVENGADDLRLSRPKIFVAEAVAQNAPRFLQICPAAFSHKASLAPGRRITRVTSRRGAAK